jgi:hypothetical protein
LCTIAVRSICRLAVFVFVALTLIAADGPTITFDNRSREDAVVRIVGSTSVSVDVNEGTQRTVMVRGGTYRTYVRYGREGKYRYMKGAPFTIYEGPDGFDTMSITLHKVMGGNYSIAPSSESEFKSAR